MPKYYVRLLANKRLVDGPFKAFQAALSSAELWAASHEDVQVEDDTADGIVVKRILRAKEARNG